MKDALTIAEIPIRQDAQGRYFLNDLHNAADGEQRHRPKYWIENQQTQELVAEISKEGIPKDGIPPLKTLGGMLSQRWANRF